MADDEMIEYVLPCTVTLSGARMFVKARNIEDALRKVAANEWNDIEYARGAELVDWDPELEAIKENK